MIRNARGRCVVSCVVLALTCLASDAGINVAQDEVKVQRHIDMTSSFKRSKRTAKSGCASLEGYVQKLNATPSIHSFVGDLNPVIEITWSGSNGVLLAFTTMDEAIIIGASRLYRSTDRGRTFREISNVLEGGVIRKIGGVHVNPLDSEHVIWVGYTTYQPSSTTKLYITNDSGRTFTTSTAPFKIEKEMFIFNPHLKHLLLFLSKNHVLYLSKDSGITWGELKQSVFMARWNPLDPFVLYYTLDPTYSVFSSKNNKELHRFNIKTNKEKLLAQHVYEFRTERDFLFLTVQFSEKNNSLVLHISKDEGDTWEAAQLPLIEDGQFYTVLDMTEEVVFVHVSSPGDVGHGRIYTSGRDGIIYSLSLERHLFPAENKATDFFKVKSLPGVYIATQLSRDKTLHSRITFDKGGTWQYIAPPRKSPCSHNPRRCHLHIHNHFSVSQGVIVPSLPLSSNSTLGLILAHGNTGDSLTKTPPNVFISNNGGYTWTQPTELVGPQYYAIGDSGGILYSIQAGKTLLDTIWFSLDEGQCWHPYKFSSKKLMVTGMSTEPGDRATDVSIWGWDKSGDMSWVVITIDFKAVLGRRCTADDYETWRAHQLNGAANSANGCLLGARRTFARRKKGTVCRNRKPFVPKEVSSPCPCRKSDFLCDYGYKRSKKNYCVRDRSRDATWKDICIDDKEEKIESQGYRLVPGDLCNGGFSPSRTIQKLHKNCAKVEISRDDYGVGNRSFGIHSVSKPSNFLHAVLLAMFVVITIVFFLFLSVIAYKKRHRCLKGYTALSFANSPPSYDYGSSGGETEVSNPGFFKRSRSFMAYHDDSDEDLIVT